MVSDNRSKILSAASALFLEGGLSALSVRAIASRAGVSTIGIYSHFDGKQGVLDTLYIEGFRYIEQAMLKPNLEMPHAQPLEKISMAAREYWQVAAGHSAHYRLIFGELDGIYQPSEHALAVAKQAFDALLALVSEVFPETVDRKQVRCTAVTIWAIVHGHIGLANHRAASWVEVGNREELTLQNVEIYLTSLV